MILSIIYYELGLFETHYSVEQEHRSVSAEEQL